MAMTKLIENLLKTIHLSSWGNKTLLCNNTHQKCGCFFCQKTFQFDEIEEFVDGKLETALCPRCGIDSVIPMNDAIDDKIVLKRMSDYAFSRDDEFSEEKVWREE